MKYIIRTIVASAFVSTAPAQGTLTPPGAPAPTMKSLDQIEARTAIPKSPATSVAGPHYTISQPGSYYLTGNIDVTTGNGIDIAASNVTLDLNGFALSSVAASPAAGAAINIAAGLNSIEIKNGRISGGTVRTYTGPKPWDATFVGTGWLVGIQDDSTAPSQGAILSELTIEKCGTAGVLLYGKCTVRNITTTGNGFHGIFAVGGNIAAVNVINNGGSGIYATGGSVNNAVAVGNGAGGIYVYQGDITNATATDNGFHGIYVSYGSVAGATATGNGFYGIDATYGSVTTAAASGNGTIGIYAFRGTVTNVTANSNGGGGIAAGHGTVTNATASNNGGTGIDASIVTESHATANFFSGIKVGAGVAAHCVATGNDTGGGAVDKQISVTAGSGQRIGCVPANE